ncbi:MAG: DUF6279 family lipoprotein [Burkholderiales bacterium]
MSAAQRAGSRLIPVMLCLLLAGGCSMVRVSYGHLDSIASWMAHDYFDLDPAQRDAFAMRFERLHAWHRREQLPEYARFIAEIRQRASRGLNAEDLLWIVDGLRQRYARIAAHGAADAAELLATLSDAQIETFRRQLDKDNRKFLREHRSNEDETARRRAAERRTLAQLRDWVGTLTDAQEARIATLLQEMPLTDRLRHEDRLRRQREFLALLQSRHEERGVFAARVRDWLVNWEKNRPPGLARAFEESWKKRAAFYAAADRLFTPAQRTHLARRLQNYSEDFIALAGEGQAVARSDCAKIAAC